ncbi:MAG: polysaccharide biosynthesis protein [Firmicutes bacterium]|nr:polysaccharide biosynthesis protein [Alicyclobacillaceae bacterium]MCL6496263.1 polysaccharide biosynthesis protein [Bacillota bacterium]
MRRRLWFYAKIGATMALDGSLINAAVYLALYLRFDTPHLPEAYLTPYLQVMPEFTLGTLALFALTRVYHRLWQYAGFRDAQVLVGAVLASAIWLGALLFWSGAAHYPRAVYLLYAVLAVALLGGWRFLLRSFYDFTWVPRLARGPRVLIVGAGKAGQLVAQELARHPETGCAIGFLDDDERKRGMQIGSLRVLGGLGHFRQVVRQYGVEQAIVAMPSAGGKVLRPLVEESRELGVKIRILPGINQVIGGQVRVSQIRDVQIEDLLQREPASVDLAEIAGYLTGRVVMVTGAGGTIGSELARQVAQFAPRRLLLVGMDETSVFEIHRELAAEFPDLATVPVVGDIRDPVRMTAVFHRERPQVIFHAAAHKHVPLMELQPEEAVRNNVEGSWRLVDLAHRYEAESFVFISTDKAVNPTSVYGATKRVGELLVRGYAQRSRTRFVSVRFGNVLGSRGSVVPIFQQQIAQGGPVTITHPDMTRYFMTVTEAAQLVIQAGAMGRGGEIFVLDMGEPIRIWDLATNLIRLSGFRPGVDIDIAVIGLRPGEKLHEELLTPEDRTRVTRHQRIFIHAEPPVDVPALFRGVEELIRRAEDGPERIRAQLKAVVPEYRPEGAGVIRIPEGERAHAIES